MRRASKMLLVFGVLLALFGGGTLFMFLQSLQQASAQMTPPVNVVVAATDIPSFKPVTADMLQLKSIPAESATPEFVRDVSTVVGKALSAPAKPGQFITGSMLTAGSFSYTIPKGKRAMSLWVDRLSVMNGLMREGDKVDVIFTREFPQINASEGMDGSASDPQERGPVGKTVVQNVQVLKIQNPNDSSKGGSLIVPENLKTSENGGEQATTGFWTVTLAVSDQEAEILAFTQRYGVAQLVVRASGDDTVQETTGVSEEILNDEKGVPVPEQPSSK